MNILFFKKQKHGEDPHHPALAPQGCLQRGPQDGVGRSVLSGSHLLGRLGRATCPVCLSLSFRVDPWSREVQTLPQAVTPAFWWCPSLFLTWVFPMNFPLQLCGGTWRLALVTRDRIRTTGVGWTREEAAHQASSECCLPVIGLCWRCL